MHNNLSARLRVGLLLGCASAALAPWSASAQSGPPPQASSSAAGANADYDKADVIVVTGSRISSSRLDSISPIQMLASDDIRRSQVVNLQEVLQQNPVFSTPTLSRTNSNFLTSGAGTATVDLRNLGTARTLVLVNSRRFVSGVANAQSVDLNSIPAQFIERVDILTGGASSIYGSDAVAGVVNIIYKDRFEALELGGQYGVSQEGDDQSKQINLTIGGNFAEGRGNVIAYAGYTQEEGVFSRDRARSAIDQTSLGGNNGNVDDLFKLVTPNFSSFSPGGRFFSSPGVTVGTFNPSNQFITGFSTNGTQTRAADGFNRSAYRTIAVPVERYLLATRARFDVTPAIRVFLEGTFAKSHTQSALEPFPISTAGTNGIFQGQNGFFNVEQRLANGTTFANPYVPAALLAALTDNTGDGLRDVSFTRRLTDIANRGNIADRTTYRIVGGVEGEFAPGWHYDAYYGYGRTDDNQTSTGQVNLANFRAALEVIPGPGGTLICRDPNAVAQGCVPANVFGRNTLSAAARQYIRADQNRTAFSSQLDAGVNISGKLFDPWGAGAIGLAVGAEYRKEKSGAASDALTQSGQNGGNAIPNTSGQFDVREGYAELNVPLLTDKPFFNQLSARGAIRVSDYSTVGTVYSWNYGLEYAPIEDIRFRAVKARSTRAPNIGELFTAPSQTFPTGLIDPCVGVTATTGGTLGAQCRAASGVNANIAANGSFTLVQADQQGISGFNSGNPNLKAERGNSFTAGVVITPKSINFLRKFSFTADYFNITIDDAIVATPRQFILQQCYQAGDPKYCAYITRRAGPEGSNSAGSLQLINASANNTGGLKTSGLDFTASFQQNLKDVGLDGILNLRASYTHLLNGYLIPLPGAARDEIAGEVGAANNRWFINADYEIAGFGINFRGTYIGKSYLDDQFVSQLTDANNNGVSLHDPRVAIGSKFYSDMQIRFKAKEHFELFAGVQNLFNVSPPPIYSGLPGDVTGTETDSGTYDAVGRRFSAGARIKF
jgi:iron complex outermembrane recepter protein